MSATMLHRQTRPGRALDTERETKAREAKHDVREQQEPLCLSARRGRRDGGFDPCAELNALGQKDARPTSNTIRRTSVRPASVPPGPEAGD